MALCCRRRAFCICCTCSIWLFLPTLGWASVIGITLTFNGCILLMLGILGEYVGRIYDESKGRPLYIVQEVYQGKKKPQPVGLKTAQYESK
ncbi:glycosyltransferase [Paenibacillus sabinae T27]|uniref:Glycosyltransferase n=1 Tax=Paenibacillus sabinae T27 TaxID=1268072 RepID=X4Z6Q2_9BACL|nr:glycosyltransferase [Paenibacillus sabinae T27]